MIACANSQAEMLRIRIGILERAGQYGIADSLRDKLAKMSDCEEREDYASEEDESTAPPDEDARLGSPLEVLCLLKRVVARLGIKTLDDLSHWNVERFRKARLSQKNIEYIYDRMATIGMRHVIGGADVPDTVPEPSPFAIDLLDGRTMEDLDQIAEDIASGQTQRKGSEYAGGKENAGWHQRIGSLMDRGSELFAPKHEKAMRRDYGRMEWFVDVAVIRIPDACRRVWGLSVTTRWTKEKTVKALDRWSEVGLQGEKGRGKCDGSWRSISVVFKTREMELQIQVKKLDGRYRVVCEDGAPLRKKDGVPLDKHARSKRGGYVSQQAAVEQANAINAALARKQERSKTKRQKRAARSAEIKRSREGRGGAVHDKKGQA